MIRASSTRDGTATRSALYSDEKSVVSRVTGRIYGLASESPPMPIVRSISFRFVLVLVASCTIAGPSRAWATCAPGQHDFYDTCVEQLSLFGQASWKETAHGAVLGNSLG